MNIDAATERAIMLSVPAAMSDLCCLILGLSFGLILARFAQVAACSDSRQKQRYAVGMSDDYTGHILEQVLDEIKAVHELVAEVPKMARKLDRVEQDVVELKQGMNAVEAAVRDSSRELADHDRRITRLEAA